MNLDFGMALAPIIKSHRSVFIVDSWISPYLFILESVKRPSNYYMEKYVVLFRDDKNTILPPVHEYIISYYFNDTPGVF